jgi:tRNA(Arg) A34 adenosine deaminase TadA
MCFSAIHWAKIDKIVYGSSIEDAQNSGFNELDISNETMKKEGNSPIVIQNNILNSECKELFEIFNNLVNKKVY